MNALKSIFSWLGRFLEKARTVMLNLGTAFVLIIITFAIIGGLSSSGPDVTEKDGRVLFIDPIGTVVDQEVFNSDFMFNFGTNSSTDQIQTRDLIALIRAAAEDEEIPAVFIDFSSTGFAGPTTALNIAKELKALRESGKRVIAFNDRLSTSSYLMASQASEVWVHPVGSISVRGLGGMRPYQKELYENLKINFHNYSQGDFKSAVEGNTRTDMSENDRLQREALLNPIWDEMKLLMAEGRDIESGDIQSFADDYVGFFGEAAIGNIAYAKANNIIDGTKSFPEFRQYMIEEFGLDEEAKTETYKTISYNEYADQMEDNFSESENEIAIITAEGTIMEGEIAQGVAGSSGVVKQIRSAHENENTKAIVFRVNSPGGSIIASEMMRDELFAAKKKGINIVVSMGDYAASGGVYISTPADYIFAEPTTITGSIGVAIALPTLENAMDYIGVNFDGVVTSKHGGWDPTQAIDEDLDKIFAGWGADAYDRFVNFVADSRSQSYEDIKAIAGGRVWIATSAKEIGLVDEIGGIDDAIAYAANLTELEDYQVEYYGQELSPEELILRELLENFDVSLGEPKVLSALNGLADLYETLTDIQEPKALLTCKDCLVDLD
ncbi:signal peptide peptidase SppA [Gammaproteobacteria bacterium]|nr:signal peptide peptidase SppA [Gammaproteobacteria bacterium]MDB4194990.1 signal peptide peptidase SppA [Gammaproteobacteria bacterium]MDB9897153.1 signal peptide peptidase SppA [Gammaproteobacteria bacterium]MDB9947454.1 signal peptide peptidase SppA [Gammaproteobacteria bacterium]MDC1484424.1 signal peptide peptidase SppA [Gammaproteobacteria bacterium]